jgi:hypothetical protein
MRRLNPISVLLLLLALIGVAVAAVKDVPLKVVLNGKAQSLKPSAVLHGENAYLPLNATAKLVRADVKYDKSKKTYTIKSGKKTTAIKESQGAKISGQLMFPLDVMAKSLGVQMKCDQKSKTITIKTSNGKEKSSGKGDKGKSCPPGG